MLFLSKVRGTYSYEEGTLPVVPEVYRMYNGAFASTGWHGRGFDLSITSSQSYWSSERALCQMFLLWNTMHRGLFTEMIFIAPFNMSVYLRVKRISLFRHVFRSRIFPKRCHFRERKRAYLTIFDGSRPQLAAITTFGFAWFILTANSFAANPRNIR